MDFISNQEPQIEEMLREIGIDSIEELWKDIPRYLWMERLRDDDGLSEFEGLRLMESLAAKNHFPEFENYLGAGAYEHHVPAIVQAICSKSEFLTSYTPYQAEASQGMLQAIFEFQSAICALTGMDVANASLYDGASAAAEALLMTLRLNKERNEVCIAESIHPHYLSVVRQYLSGYGAKVKLIPALPDGSLNEEFLEKTLNEQTAALLVQSPNFFGVIESSKAHFALAKERGALCVLCANPMSYGLFATAKEVEADIAVGDTQPFGLSLEFGGPYVGYIACVEKHLRQLPGRIVGLSRDSQGNKGFVLTLQAREQHIRREKATSNICTNQALAALASLIAILWYGKKGLEKLAITNYQRACFLKEHLESHPSVIKVSSRPIFNEFIIEFKKPLDQVIHQFRLNKIMPGLQLRRYYPARSQQLLIAVTETKNREQLQRFLQVVQSL